MIVEEASDGSVMNRILLHTMRRIKALKYVQRLIEHQVLLQSTTTSRNETMCPDTRFITSPSNADADMLQEYFIPPEGLELFLNDMRKIVQENQINLINATIRYVKKDEQSALAYAPKDCFAIVIYFNQSLADHRLKKMESWTQQIIEASLKQQGTFYLPYHRFASISQFQKAYPTWKTFKEYKKHYDPKEIFSSQFYAHYF